MAPDFSSSSVLEHLRIFPAVTKKTLDFLGGFCFLWNTKSGILEEERNIGHVELGTDLLILLPEHLLQAWLCPSVLVPTGSVL